MVEKDVYTVVSQDYEPKRSVQTPKDVYKVGIVTHDKVRVQLTRMYVTFK